MNSSLVTWGIILFSVSFFYLFVCVNEYSNTCLGATKRVLFYWLPANIKIGVTKVCGDRVVKIADRIQNYLFW